MPSLASGRSSIRSTSGSIASNFAIIFNHAQDRVIFADRVARGPARGSKPTSRRWNATSSWTSGPEPADLPTPWVDYEQLMEAAADREEFPGLDENTAAGLCYTSGTTGEPKGVLYSHRSTYLHAMSGCMVDTSAVGERETVLPVVPMFHVNAWGLPYSGTLAGAKQVFPGPLVLDRPLAELLEAERVTLRHRHSPSSGTGSTTISRRTGTTSRACTPCSSAEPPCLGR